MPEIFSEEELKHFKKYHKGEIFEDTDEEQYRDVTSLNNELFKRYVKKSLADEDKLLEAIEKKRSIKKRNYFYGGKKRSYKSRIKKATTEQERKKLQFILNRFPDKLPHTAINSTIKKYAGEDFHITINDRFHGVQGYKIRASTLLNKRNPAFYLLTRMGNKVKEGIHLAEDEHKKDILKKLHNKIEYNKKLVKFGYIPKEYAGVDKARYVMLIEFFGDDFIELNL